MIAGAASGSVEAVTSGESTDAAEECLVRDVLRGARAAAAPPDTDISLSDLPFLAMMNVF
jgi:hypothetical protein